MIKSRRCRCVATIYMIRTNRLRRKWYFRNGNSIKHWHGNWIIISIFPLNLFFFGIKWLFHEMNASIGYEFWYQSSHAKDFMIEPHNAEAFIDVKFHKLQRSSIISNFKAKQRNKRNWHANFFVLLTFSNVFIRQMIFSTLWFAFVWPTNGKQLKSR